MGTTRSILCAALAAGFALAACADDAASDPTPKISPGVVSVAFSVVPLAVPDLALNAATLRVSHVSVLGNAPPPPPGPPPPGSPHPHPGSSSSSLDLNVLSPVIAGVALTDLPQGLYSRVEFFVGNVAFSGTWRGVPLRAELAAVMRTRIDLRAGTARELGPNQNATFAVSLDPNLWFAGALLAGAAITDGEIVCDAQTNPEIATELTNRLGRSFAVP